MAKIDPSLQSPFVTVIRFLTTDPDSAYMYKGVVAGEEEHISRLATKFQSGRAPSWPEPPKTVPDEMVSTILHICFDVPTSELSTTKIHHALSMGAENVVGELLERYLAHVLEPVGWVWCSGSIVKSVDFVKDEGRTWTCLQVKNRDNSENSSSSKVRVGTNIQKWFRTFSKSTGTNWAEFPDKKMRTVLSEANFRAFVEGYLAKQKQLRKA